VKIIGLCMIVKNEAGVILRCLDSVRPLVDYVLVEDTGSTDGTQEIIRNWLKRESISGEVFDEPWRDFAHNRSVALARLRKNKAIDYAFVMDADDELVFCDAFDPQKIKEQLVKDCYEIEIRRFDISYQRPQLCSNRLHFQYFGVLHEVMVGPKAGYSTGKLEELYIDASGEGARSADPEKYRKDVQVLERALKRERDPWLRSRYTFYLAQSYWDCGERVKAIEAYSQRVKQGYWKEEIYWSYYQIGRLRFELGESLEKVLPCYQAAFRVAPDRAEPMCYAARWCREAERFAEGYEFAKSALGKPQPPYALFVEPWVYQYGLLDEYAVNAYWIGRYEECLAACEQLLVEDKIPEDMRGRIEANANFAREKLKASALSD
jgi:glycosyltransferase involved in cell wall biosynthesis